MRTRICYPFILLIALLTTVSCENELPFSVKDNPPKLVMNALINADSLTNVLYLNFTGRGYATHVENATVEVRVNGQLSESLRPLPPQTEGDMQCRFNISGKFYNFVSYGTNDEGFIDYEELYKQANKCKPKLIVAGASAYPRVIDFPKLASIARAVGAYLMVDMAHIAGLVAAGQHISPVPYADVVTTTTHKTLRGPRGGLILTNNEYIAKKINSAIFPGVQGGPLMHVIAGKAVCFGEALKPEFKTYGEQIVKNAKVLADTLLEKGFKLVSGGTDNHLMLVDLRPFDITGKDLQNNLDECYITVNKNAIPNDPQKPALTSGVRIGTPAVTTRGLKEDDMRVIGECIYLTAKDFESNKEKVRGMVNELCAKYPLYE